MASKKYTPESFDEYFEVSEEQLPEAPTTHTVGERENILTIATQYLPEGWTRQEYAEHLLANNGSFAVGKVIHLG